MEQHPVTRMVTGDAAILNQIDRRLRVFRMMAFGTGHPSVHRIGNHPVFRGKGGAGKESLRFPVAVGAFLPGRSEGTILVAVAAGKVLMKTFEREDRIMVEGHPSGVESFR